MIKISLGILAVYLMYYAGNILYDLFLKKEKEVYKEETEEFSLSEISDQYEASAVNIGIEDVENLNTPKSFNKNQIHSDQTEVKNERQDLEYLREQFESEQDLDEPAEIKFENTEDFSSKIEKNSQKQTIEESASSVQRSNKNKWHQMLNLAETSVQLISHNDGYKTYRSTM